VCLAFGTIRSGSSINTEAAKYFFAIIFPFALHWLPSNHLTDATFKILIEEGSRPTVTRRVDLIPALWEFGYRVKHTSPTIELMLQTVPVRNRELGLFNQFLNSLLFHFIFFLILFVGIIVSWFVLLDTIWVARGGVRTSFVVALRTRYTQKRRLQIS